MEKLFLATLWAKLLIITVNFGNKTKVFSENFGWLLKVDFKKVIFSCNYVTRI